MPGLTVARWTGFDDAFREPVHMLRRIPRQVVLVARVSDVKLRRGRYATSAQTGSSDAERRGDQGIDARRDESPAKPHEQREPNREPRREQHQDERGSTDGTDPGQVSEYGADSTVAADGADRPPQERDGE